MHSTIRINSMKVILQDNEYYSLLRFDDHKVLIWLTSVYKWSIAEFHSVIPSLSKWKADQSCSIVISIPAIWVKCSVNLSKKVSHFPTQTPSTSTLTQAYHTLTSGQRVTAPAKKKAIPKVGSILVWKALRTRLWGFLCIGCMFCILWYS